MLERNEKQLPKETVRLLSFYSFHCFTRCSSSQYIYYQCLKSISFLYFSRDDLRTTIGIICGRGSFLAMVWGSSAVGDHLRHCTVFVACVFQGDWTNNVDDVMVDRLYQESKRFQNLKRFLRAEHLHILVFEHNSILYRCSMRALY